MHGFLSIKVDGSLVAPGYFAFSNCYAVSRFDNGHFFYPGDSGCGVYVKYSDGRLKPLGIGFAFLNSETAVCRIDKIVDKLGLDIVSYIDIRKILMPSFQPRMSIQANHIEQMECS